MAETSHIRVSDQEREQAATAIREHFAAGRLDGSEFEERLQAVYAARTAGELQALAADLPALPAMPPTKLQRARQIASSSEMTRNVVAGSGGFIACTAVWLATGAQGAFWPKWILIATAFSIVRGARRGSRRRGRRD